MLLPPPLQLLVRLSARMTLLLLQAQEQKQAVATCLLTLLQVLLLLLVVLVELQLQQGAQQVTSRLSRMMQALMGQHSRAVRPTIQSGR